MADERIGVLVVDNEPICIDVVRNCLNAAGYAIFAAAGYDEALATFETRIGEIGLLIVEISLPGKPGIEVAKSCLSLKPSLRVLFISGWVEAEWLDYAGIPKPDTYFLPKPFRSSTLVNRVRQILESTEPITWLDKGRKVRIGGFSAT